MNRKHWFVLCVGIMVFSFIFFIIVGSQGFDFDEKSAIRDYLSYSGYVVNDVQLIGTTAYIDMNASGTKVGYDLKNNFNWTWQVWYGMTYTFIVYDIEPDAYDIQEMPRREIENLGIDYDEIEYMSDEELAEVAEIIGKRASTSVVIMRTPTIVCSYKLNRATYEAWSNINDITSNSKLSDSLYLKMDNEIKKSESCS